MPVEWLGALDDTADFLHDLDLFALVAEPAGCPNASLEAMAAGLAGGRHRRGGMAEQVENGVTGGSWAVRMWHGLAEALVEAANDLGLRESWGDAGRRAAERFGLARMVEAYARICLPTEG